MTLTYADLHDPEVRIIDPATGGAKGVKATQIGALDPIALLIMGRVGGIGAMKYSAFNFLKGYSWSHSFNAAMRHLTLFWAGEDIDVCNVHGAGDHAFVFGQDEGNCDGTNLPHPALAAWHGHTLTSFWARGIGTDDRPPRLEARYQRGRAGKVVEFSPGFLLEDMAALVGCGMVWGEPDAEGVYTPTFTWKDGMPARQETDVIAVNPAEVGADGFVERDGRTYALVTEEWGTGDGLIIEPTKVWGADEGSVVDLGLCRCTPHQRANGNHRLDCPYFYGL